MSNLKVLSVNDDLPIKTFSNVHSGKVRSVYWLTKEDSRRLIEDKNYDVPVDTPLAITYTNATDPNHLKTGMPRLEMHI